MRIIARRTLRDFIEARAGRKDHRALKSALDAWYREANKAAWANMAEVKQKYGTASPVTAERIVFNIKGNDYRLVVAVNFSKQIVFIKWIGTHADYNKIDVEKVQYAD